MAIAKTIVGLSLLAACGIANAQGFMLGYMMGSDKEKKDPAPMVLYSNKHDVITCKKQWDEVNRCTKIGPHREYLTPAQFAYAAGYKVLHRQAIAMYDRDEYIVMEVSK